MTIFYRIKKELASWIAIWRFLRRLDRYTWNARWDIDERADARKNAEPEEGKIKVARHHSAGGADKAGSRASVMDRTQTALTVFIEMNKGFGHRAW